MTAPTAEASDGNEDSDPESAFTAFYASSFSRLVLWGRAKGLHSHDANDAAQDAMIRIYSKWSELYLRPEATRVVYAWRTLNSAAVDLQRHAGRQRDRLTAMAPFVRVAEPDASGGTEALDLLGRLDGNQREVMLLAYEGLSASDIAEHLDLTPSAVRSHLHNARKTLRPQWGRKEIDHG